MEIHIRKKMDKRQKAINDRRKKKRMCEFRKRMEKCLKKVEVAEGK